MAPAIVYGNAGYVLERDGAAWCGATVETADVEALTPWLDWAFQQVSPA